MIRLVGGPLDGKEVFGDGARPIAAIPGTEISIVLTDAESGHQTLSDQWTIVYFVSTVHGFAEFIRESPGPAEPFGNLVTGASLR